MAASSPHSHGRRNCRPTIVGIEKYLGSGLVKGIGPKFAKLIVSLFGLETFDVIEKDADRLLEVPGIGKTGVALIRESWEKQKDVKDIMVFLQGHGVSSTRVRSNYWYESEHQDQIVYTLLSRYLTKKEVSYYMRIINEQAKRFRDSYVQVIQVIQEKEGQEKFASGTKQYKRNNIMDYVLKINLKDFGWSIAPPSTRKDRRKSTPRVE